MRNYRKILINIVVTLASFIIILIFKAFMAWVCVAKLMIKKLDIRFRGTAQHRSTCSIIISN